MSVKKIHKAKSKLAANESKCTEAAALNIEDKCVANKTETCENEHKHAHSHSHDGEGEHSHFHTHEDNHGEGEAHSHSHTHAHGHVHTETKAVINRLARAIGHLEAVKRMVEEGRDCSEVLVQLAAVRAALGSTAKVVLKDHIEHCLIDAAESGDIDSISMLNTAIERFIT
ncbi:MAG: metal-sensing transcriptional repressor [Ruminococcaceae bacterium]|nr:metal-sensing transcriptional repressor [Oscillospiraceae bacterium]